ncbi:late embryogenesis abundant protein D-29-like [Pistacia vera]|uniref:late embryogenesis abundant protein D-29-like n=1 Tax=Pistacia vera TaxID=55513 RepID=UPI0012636E05|nr:late embryogenesis abundant protein D-29-like [Pistacia vera]
MGKTLVLLLCVMLVLVSTRVVFGQEHQDKAESWTDWAKDKLNKTFGIDQDKTKEKAGELMEDAANATSDASGSLKNATSEASNYASEKAEEATNATSDEIQKAKDYGRKTMEFGYNDKVNKPLRKGKRVLRSLSESAAEQGKDTIDKSKDAYNDAKENVKSGSAKAKETMGGAMESGKDNVEHAYDEAKNQVGEAYDGAKDKASKAASNIGV